LVYNQEKAGNDFLVNYDYREAEKKRKSNLNDYFGALKDNKDWVR
jgi:hypothetical protein